MNNHLLPIFLPYVPLAMKLTPVCEMPLPNGEGESTSFNICFWERRHTIYLDGRLSG